MNKAADNKPGGCYAACFQSVCATFRINNDNTNKIQEMPGHTEYISSSGFICDNQIITGSDYNRY